MKMIKKKLKNDLKTAYNEQNDQSKWCFFEKC